MLHRSRLMFGLVTLFSIVALVRMPLLGQYRGNGNLQRQIEFVSELIDKSEDRLRWSHHARMEFARSAMDNAAQLENESLRMRAMFCLAELYFHEGKFDIALAFFDTLFLYATSNRLRELEIKSRIYQGSIYRYRGDLYRALGVTHEARQWVDTYRQQHLKALAANNLGVIYRNLGDNDMAMTFYQEALASAQEHKDTAQIIQSYISMGNLHWFRKEAEEALGFYHRGMNLATQSRDLQHISSLTNNIANTFRDQGEFDKALELYFQALEQQNEVFLVGLKMIILRNIGITYQRKGDLINAFNYVNRSLDLSRELNLLQFIRDNHFILSELYKQTGDFTLAYENLSEFNRINQQVFNDQLLNSIAYFNERVFDANQREELYRFRLERNLLILILVVLALVFVVSFTALTYHRFKEKRAHIRSLQDTLREKETTERALRRSEENYQTLIKTLNEGLVVLDMKNQIEFVNLKACKLLGVDEKRELLGKSFEKFLLTPEDEKLFQDKMELQKMGISDHYEVKMKNMSGDVMWVNLSSAPILDENLKAKGSVTLISDVSERKKSEETYGELTSNLNQKIKQLNCLYDISDISGVPGITFEEIIEKSIEIIPVGLKYSHDIAVEIVFDDKVYRSANYRETPWVYQVPVKVQKKKLGHIQVVYLEEKPIVNKDPFHFNEKILLKNISEKFGQILEAKNTDRILRDNQERLEEIQRLARIGNWEKHHDTGEVKFSDTLFEIAGISPERRRFFDLDKLVEMIHPEDKDVFKTLVRENPKEDPLLPFSANFRLICQDGSIRYIFSGRKKIFNEQGRILRTVFTLQDVSEQKMSQQLQYNTEIALKTSEARQQVLTKMSFDMRTPVNGIMGVVDFLLQSKLNRDQAALVATLKDSGQELIGIINNIAELSRLEDNRLHLNVQKTDMQAFLNRIHELFGVISRQKDVQLKVKIDKTLPKVIVTDQERLFQLFSNLMTESVKRSTSGTLQVELSLESVLKDQLAILVEMGTHTSKKGTRKSAKTPDGENPSQSLAISRKLAEMLGGNMEVDEDTPESYKVHFTFLARMAAETEEEVPQIEVAEEQNPIEMEPIAGLRVLCVEDRIINQKVLTLMLSHAGCEISMANNGSEAIELMLKNEYDLVLLDMVMPVMDGLETLKVMKKKFTIIPPVIAVTAKTAQEDKELYLASGAVDFIAKPVNAKELYQKLAYWHSQRVNESVSNAGKN